MKNVMLKRLVISFLGIAVVFTIRAASTIQLLARPGSKVVIEGTSSIHDWTVTGNIIGGSIEIEDAFITDLSLKSVESLQSKEKNPKVTVTIPARSLKSGKQKMDEIMLEAMKAKEFPFIKFTLTSMIVKGDVPTTGTPVKFDVTGELEVSGVKKTIDMVVTLDRLPNNQFKFSGEKKLKMTDFGITPPSPDIPGLARITTGDDITVKFEWIVAPKQ